MAEYYIKSGGKTVGPVTGSRLKQLVDEGKIERETFVSKYPNGPFTPAGSIKGLFPEGIGEPDTEPAPVQRPRRKRLAAIPDAPEYPLLTLWIFALGAGTFVALLSYAAFWKFSGPVWFYGATLIGPSVTMFIVSWFLFSRDRSKLSSWAMYVNAALLTVALIGTVGSIYDYWTLESRMKSTFERANREIERPFNLEQFQAGQSNFKK